MSKVKYPSVKLLECIKLSSGKFLPAKKRIDGEYNVYGGNGVSGKHNDYFVEEPTIVIGRVGEYCGCVHISNAKSWITDNALYVTKFLKAFDIRYLCYVLNKENLNRLANVSGQPSISQANILNCSIKIPPLDIQKHIAETLDKGLEIISLHKKRLEELDNLIKSTFYDIFGDPVINDREWQLIKLSEITSKIGSGSTPRGGQQSYKESGISLVRSLNVHNGFFKYEQLAYIDDDQAKQLENVKLEENDVLINITGASVCRSCIIPSNVLPARVNQHVSILRGIDKFVNSFYLNNLLINNSYQNKLLVVATSGGATREAITKQQLQNLEIPLPPIELQNKFAQIVKKIEEQKNLEKQAISESENLFNSLMSKYFD
jgi:Restriction endonuclease S subunits